MELIDSKNLKPATEKDLLEKRGIIYAIVNTYDGKTYIGQTRYTFHERYAGCWWRNTTNILLKRTLKKQSHCGFKIYILESDISQDKLNEKERFFANILQCYCPRGYNLVECGNGGIFYGKETLKKVRKARKETRKKYKLKHIETQEVFDIIYLKDWCAERNLKETAIRNVLCGLVLKSQGYCLPETSNEKISSMRLAKSKEYIVKHIKTGEIIKFKNVTIFADKNNLEENSFRCMLCGAHNLSQGYCLPETKIRTKLLYFKDPYGNSHKILEIDRANFAKENELNRDDLSRLSCGKYKTCKGWSFIRSEDLVL